MHHPHRYAMLPDASIDARRTHRDRRLALALITATVVTVLGILMVCLGPEGPWTTAGTGVALLGVSVLMLVGPGSLSTEDDLAPLSDSPRRLNQALKVLRESEEARRTRDEILGLGRSLRVFDLPVLVQARDQAHHARKVRRLNGQAA